MRRRGITLVELLITAVVLGLVAPSIVGAVNASFVRAKSLERRAIALSLATADIEAFRASCMADTVQVSTFGRNVDAGDVGKIYVLSTVTNPTQNLGEVVVTASWTEQRGTRVFTDSVRLATAMETNATW